MMQEQFKWLAKHPATSKRFGRYVGERCINSSISAVSKELGLDWKTVKEMEKEYMRTQIDKAPEPGPRVIGIDEISIKKGHEYRIIVSDLEEKRPIWFGGKDRSKESLDEFYDWLGKDKAERIRLSVMDMWKAFTTSTRIKAKNSAILYDKFHVIRHLNEALDRIRKSEYRRLAGSEEGRFIKGQKYSLLSREKNLEYEAKKSLDLMLSKNKRLYTAYILKESFEQMWEYKYEGAARNFFEKWKESLEGQELKAYEKFAEMIESHWDGIAAYCKEENKVSLGFVEGLNNKIRVIQRRAYGLRDPEYIRLKVLSCMLPPLKPTDE